MNHLKMLHTWVKGCWVMLWVLLGCMLIYRCLYVQLCVSTDSIDSKWRKFYFLITDVCCIMTGGRVFFLKKITVTVNIHDVTVQLHHKELKGKFRFHTSSQTIVQSFTKSERNQTLVTPSWNECSLIQQSCAFYMTMDSWYPRPLFTLGTLSFFSF